MITTEQVPAALSEKIRVTHALAKVIARDLQRLEALNRDLQDEWHEWLDTLGPWATSKDGYEEILNPAEEAAGMDGLWTALGALVAAADDAYCPKVKEAAA